MFDSYKIILASGSPRRKQLLEQTGFEFEICVSACEEKITSTDPEKVCMELSLQKALDVASMIKAYNEKHSDIASDRDLIIIGADTIVAVDDEILGKPKDDDEAILMLKKLSGKEHSVYTGVSFVFMSSDGRVGEHSFFERTGVSVYDLDEDEITAYVDSGEPLDKAGAYGIQGGFAKYIEKISGDYFNVVGLPVSRLYHELKKLLG
jgi:septum formation protein